MTPAADQLNGYAMLHQPTLSADVIVFQLDAERQKIVLLAETPAAGPDKDYELWILPDGKGPVSLGVLKAGERIERPIDEMRVALIQPGTTLAVSLEPAGGSVSGTPTGPVLYTGGYHLATKARPLIPFEIRDGRHASRR